MKFYIITLLLCGCVMGVDIDKNTFSNYREVQMQHLHIEWLLNLNQKIIDGSAEYTFRVTTAELKEVHLDIYQMDIKYAYYPNFGKVLDWHVESDPKQSLIQGDKLIIELGQSFRYGDIFKLRIKYQIGEQARALSFMNIEQTDDKKAPYLFSQCEANNCRSMIPLQDTPSIKFTYSASVLTQDQQINVFMSGLPVENTKFSLMEQYNLNGIANIFQFELKIKIPSYLIAIVAGTVQERKTSDRTSVISEAKNIEIYQKELEHLDKYVKYLEDYIGDYKWGFYKIVILPASFPFGGMENPLLTFANPSIIVGDKSGISVAIHEIAHSWFGNTVTCNNWSNMWINEGFCVFLERKGLLQHYESIDLVYVNSLVGNDEMNALIKEFNSNHDPVIKSYASLHPITENHNADDSFSTIPYERGYQLLLYLEKLVSEDKFQLLLQAWLQQNQYQSVDENDFYNFMIAWIQSNFSMKDFLYIKQQIDSVYIKWIYNTDAPPYKYGFINDASLLATNLAEDWASSRPGEQPQGYEIFDKFQSNQKQLFLSSLLKKNLDPVTMKQLDSTYNLTNNLDAELLFRWYTLSIQTKYATDFTNLKKIRTFVSKIGRMKMINPIYKALDKKTAETWYNENIRFYHPLARQSIENIIKNKGLDVNVELL
ncbi:unnamed protein product [Paramecium sonneborni]|uniref:Peptidase M1 leukotriene A4 hydrolase/aminopeptidase C-terminal domain-containing protein n=1 Tax=Paramecium sonneborni TaxID=65129 RepID=A0A8S1NMX1_9CILI|nr:unnamed protein product [Paramecium sonneborni]